MLRASIQRLGRKLSSRTNLYREGMAKLASSNYLIDRHLGPDALSREEMLKKIGVSSMEELIEKILPLGLPSNDLPEWSALTEEQTVEKLALLASQNKSMKNYLGWGYSGTHTPLVILRNVLSNPGWYTSYTPYQSEISQGRLETLLLYQTTVSSLTGLPAANASLLDEATAAAESMTMAYNLHNRKKKDFLVSDKAFPQTIAVIQTRAEPLGINIHVADLESFDLNKYKLFGVLAQSPDKLGEVTDFTLFGNKVKEAGASFIIGSDLLSLCVMKSPGDMHADIAYGNSQRFGVPMGYGGPHAAFYSSKDSPEYIRKIPGRVIGVSKDKSGRIGYRMTLQTREQHIRRGKATSNICTAQALLANMAGLYALYHGPTALKEMAERVYSLTGALKSELEGLNLEVITKNHFDTIAVRVKNAPNVVAEFEKHGINIRQQSDTIVSISLDETTSAEDVAELATVFSQIQGNQKSIPTPGKLLSIPKEIARETPILNHPIFKSVPSESQMLRYLYRLQRKDISLANSMIPLGSCTMKLNASCQMIPITNKGFSNIHPHAPDHQVKGYHEMIAQLRERLLAITGFDEISFQPNSGAQGEYAGLMTIRNYHRNNGDSHRNVCLIPVSAHGTNPATASMVGMDIVDVECEKTGNISLEDFKAKAEKHKDRLASCMITYPSTYGIYDSIGEVIDCIHSFGGQVYMDGANMNAQVGVTAPGKIGADVCHLNLHKTFAIPHGGGGPGMGPIGVRAHLAPFLPRDVVVNKGGSGGQISSFHFGSASILPISWAYIYALGDLGCTESTKHAMLNANYIRKRLEKYYNVVFVNDKGFVAHELIIDLRPFKVTAEVTEDDVAKRLIDFGFHSPTMSFPIPGTLMIEPTESEDMNELDRFCEALIKIREEIHEVESGQASKTNNVLKNAPHSLHDIVNSNWERPYSRQKAAFPLPWIELRGKYWPTVSRVDNVWGDRHPVITLPDMDFHF